MDKTSKNNKKKKIKYISIKKFENGDEKNQIPT